MRDSSNNVDEHAGSKRPASLADPVLRRMLHDVAQPVTVLGMLLMDAAGSGEGGLDGPMLHLACAECAKISNQIRQLQALVAVNSAVPQQPAPGAAR